MTLFEEHDTTLNTAAFNLAMEDHLFSKPGINLFRLWQNKSAVIIGRNQNAYSEINDDFVVRNGIEVIRRMTGGGAVYHDIGNLNFSFFMQAGGAERIDFKRFMTPIVTALRERGINAEISGRNDLVAAGKKFSGNAQLIRQGRVLHHGTILINSNLDILRQALNVSEEKLKSKAVSSVRSRVVNLSEIVKQATGEIMVVEDFKRLLLERLPISSVYNSTDDDYESARQLENTRYGKREWNYGITPICDLKKEIYINGIGMVEMHFIIKDDIINSCEIFGDFFDDGYIANLKKLIIGRRFNEIDFNSINPE